MSFSGLEFDPTADVRHYDSRVALGLWQGLALGLLAAMAWAACAGPGAWLQAGGAWLVLAPAASLLAWYRHELTASWQGMFVSGPGRRGTRAAPRQARRLRSRSRLPTPVRQAA